MARYDYGFRGTSDTTNPRFGASYGARYADDILSGRQRRLPMNRVTAPYNVDYLRPQNEPYPIARYRFGGEWPDQIVGEDEYRYPYITRSGTHLGRRSVRYDYRDFGSDFGGRFPDEL